MKRILVPCDFSKPSVEAFKTAINLAAKSNGSVTVLHAIFISTLYDPNFIGEPTTNTNQFFESMEKEARKAFEQLQKQFDQKRSSRLNVVIGALFDSIEKVSEEEGIDLIVMGTTGSSGLEEILVGSNTEKVVRLSNTPVLVVRNAIEIDRMKNILVPTTGALDQSAFISKLQELQKSLNAKLHCLLINTPKNFKRTEEGKEILNEFAKHYRLNNYELHFKNYRDEEQGILDFANENKVDLIAMATHSRKGLAHLFQGSITENVVNHVPTAVWTYSIRK